MTFTKRLIPDIKSYIGYAYYSARASLKTEVAGSYLNWIWWILEPFCLMLIYAFIFGVVFDARELYFPAFIFVGLAAWQFFNNSVKSSIRIVKKEKSILSKVYVPKYILLISKMMINGFKMLISFLIVVVLIIFFKIPLSWNILYAPLMILGILLFTFACMCFLAHFGVYVEDLENLVTIALRLVFYMTGIMFNIRTRIGGPHPTLAFILGKCNPMAYYITGLRDCVLYSQAPELSVMIFWYITSILLSILGIRLIYKNENSYIKVV